MPRLVSKVTRAEDCQRMCLGACIKKKSGNLGVQKYADCEKEYKKVDWCEIFGGFLGECQRQDKDLKNVVPRLLLSVP